MSEISVDDILEHLDAKIVAHDWLLDMFVELNGRHFKSALVPPTLAEGNHNDLFAFYVPLPHRIVVFHPRVLEQDRRWIADSFLHEMVHMALERAEQDVDQGHGPQFVKEANRIGRMLGLKPVRPGSDDAIKWPQSMRKTDLWV